MPKKTHCWTPAKLEQAHRDAVTIHALIEGSIPKKRFGAKTKYHWGDVPRATIASIIDLIEDAKLPSLRTAVQRGYVTWPSPLAKRMSHLCSNLIAHLRKRDAITMAHNPPVKLVVKRVPNRPSEPRVVPSTTAAQLLGEPFQMKVDNPRTNYGFAVACCVVLVIFWAFLWLHTTARI